MFEAEHRFDHAVAVARGRRATRPCAQAREDWKQRFAARSRVKLGRTAASTLAEIRAELEPRSRRASWSTRRRRWSNCLKTALGESLAPLFDEGLLAAPELLDAEVLAVLRREVATYRLSATRAREALDDLRDWDVERIGHRELLSDAWALRGRVTAYDALYVAAARQRMATLVRASGWRRW